MNKRFFYLTILLALVMAAVASARNAESAQAQGGCRDRAGNPIPCPGQEKNTPTPIPPTVTSTPLPTGMALPITNPTEESALKGTVSVDCYPGEKQLACVVEIANICGNNGGTASTSEKDDGTINVTCTIPMFIDPTPLALINPTQDSTTEQKGQHAGCFGGDNVSRLTCALDYAQKCKDAGGTSTINTGKDHISVTCSIPAFMTIESTPLQLGIPTDDSSTEGKKTKYCPDTDGGIAIEICRQSSLYICAKAGGTSSESSAPGGMKVTCSQPVFNEIDPTLLPLAVPMNEDNWIGRCTQEDAVNGSLADCFARYTCEDGTLVVKVDLYSGDGTAYDFYCVPQKPTFPPGGWLPWITGLGGLLIGMLLPAIQKYREPSPRPSGRMPNNKNPDLMKNQDDGEPTAQKRGKRSEAELNSTPDGEAHADAGKETLSAHENDEDGIGGVRVAVGDVNGDGVNLQGNYLETRSGSALPQTREHVLLANQPEPPTSGAIKTIAAAQTDYNEPPTHEDGMQLKAKRAEVDPSPGVQPTAQTSEDIL